MVGRSVRRAAFVPLLRGRANETRREPSLTSQGRALVQVVPAPSVRAVHSGPRLDSPCSTNHIVSLLLYLLAGYLAGARPILATVIRRLDSHLLSVVLHLQPPYWSRIEEQTTNSPIFTAHPDKSSFLASWFGLRYRLRMQT
ncbi:hypothetical protein K466DRAFT_385119 [Polyporus arcularius HHB13444]|uniref:Uncharacterized protein n=1 Tax=Polyporus arcularius HHB13444 TaxID=1314778 RepID=A0A5C3NS23_9APHY|nr:hypothetical protein K466DRAFT_385119 [Polyporus arcularius HHB13444]